ncbi:MAG TPA: HAD hydrolase family protein [Burkholderiales bacterium]|nr:HAD hydrolase family protein [Burkholderiales bacterium]
MTIAASDALERARRVRLMAFDVDGVLTDGRLWYGPAGETMKAFHVQDGLAIKMLAGAGIATAIITSRRSEAVAIRAAELDIAHVLQGVEDKYGAFRRLLEQLALDPLQAGYMGDDLPDLPVLRRCGLACAPKEAVEPVRRHAHYVTHASAGAGAAREVCEFVLQAQGRLESTLAAYLS